MLATYRPLVLMILDGFGYRESSQYNAISAANPHHWQQLWEQQPHTLLDASGLAVGLPADQMGNSEVGHLHMGAGRTVFQDLTRIDRSIESGDFFQDPTLRRAMREARENHKKIHVLGLLSPGGVHSHENHFAALVKMAHQQNIQDLFVHAFLDGRDTPPKSAATSIALLEKCFTQYNVGKIASIVGRYYAMDRDNRWDRIQQAYDLLTQAKTHYPAQNALSGLDAAYARGETDEFVKPTWISNAPPIAADDVIIFMNFRADRARQLTRVFMTGDTPITQAHRFQHFFSLTEYAKDIKTQVVFAPQNLANTLGEYIAEKGLAQLRLAETEKYAHVTFFFNGGHETPFPHEARIMIPSPRVATYDLQPEMSAKAVTEALLQAISQQKFDVIICNFANPDMVGHTGDFVAATKAIQTIDACLAQIIPVLKACQGELLITADHGNVECMFDEKSQQPHTAHTTEPVPFVYVGPRILHIAHEHGTLADIAPTMLYLLNLPIPAEMTGRPLLSAG